MRMGALLLIGLLSACMAKSPQTETTSFTPDKETLRTLRDLAEKVDGAEPARAAKISLLLARTRLYFFALASAAREENLIIIAGSAAEALGPCAGIREDPCDLAILERIIKDLSIARKGGQEEAAKEIAPLVGAMRKLASKEAEGIQELAALLSSEDPFTATAARLFALGRVAEAWEDASRAPATEAFKKIFAVAPLLCPEENSCTLPEDIPAVYATPANARVLAVAAGAARLLAQLEKEPGEWAEAARTHSLKPLAASFARILPLEPVVPVEGEVQAPTAAMWRESFLSLGVSSEILQQATPRLYVSLINKEVSLGLAPGVQILKARPVLLDQRLGFGFPGKKVAAVDDASLPQSLASALTEARAALAEAGIKEPSQETLAILSDARATASALTTLVRALSEAGITDTPLLVSPKDAPKGENSFIFGASIPLKLGPGEEPAATLRLTKEGAGSLLPPKADTTAAEGANPFSFQTTEELLAYLSEKPLPRAPLLAPSPDASVGTLVGVLDALRTASKDAWGPIQGAPLRIEEGKGENEAGEK